MSLNGIKILTALPRIKKDAISIRQLGKLINIPQTTIYAHIKPLFDWDNLGQIPKKTKAQPEMHFYLKKNFTILFNDNETSIILHEKGEIIDF